MVESDEEPSTCTTTATEKDQREEPATSAVPRQTASHDEAHDLDSEDEEEIREWNLRFLFQEYRFEGPIWQGLKDAGWTYHNGPYHSPGAEYMTFRDGKHICEYLDQFCIPPIHNTLQLPPANPLNGMTREEIARGEELRNAVVRAVYKRMAAKERGKQNEDTDKEEEEETTVDKGRSSSRQSSRLKQTNTSTAAATEETTTSKQRTRSRRHSSRLQETSKTATAFEKGADTFLRRSRESNKVTSQDMAFLKFPSVNECVEKFGDFSSKEVDEIENGYKDDFDDWKFLLTTQNSLLLYGFGSKRCVLDSFVQDKLEEEGDVLTIDGFDRDVRIESILDLLVQHFLDGEEPQQGKNGFMSDRSVRVGVTYPSMIATHEVVQRATRIARSLAVKQRQERRPLYFVLHNIDGPCLQSRDIQEALAALVAHSAIDDTGVNAVRLVASIDHVNASALLWDNRTSANFSWIWREVHTYRPYIEELKVGAVQDERKRHRSKKRQADEMDDTTLWNVLATLAPRHAEVVKILATLQSEDLQPVDHSALLRNCKHKMTVTNDSTLRAYLTELVDHGIVETGKDVSTGREWLRIPQPREKLLEIRDFDMES